MTLCPSLPGWLESEKKKEGRFWLAVSDRFHHSQSQSQRDWDAHDKIIFFAPFSLHTTGQKTPIFICFFLLVRVLYFFFFRLLLLCVLVPFDFWYERGNSRPSDRPLISPQSAQTPVPPTAARPCDYSGKCVAFGPSLYLLLLLLLPHLVFFFCFFLLSLSRLSDSGRVETRN